MERESPNSINARRSASVVDIIDSCNDLHLLYFRYKEEIVRFLTRAFGEGPPDPEDVVQAVFERFARARRQEQVHNVRAFLFRSARNYVIDEKRRQSVRAEYAVSTLATLERSDHLDAERIMMSRQSWAAIEMAISQLDAQSRDMLLMNRIHGLSYIEIARRHGCSATLVKSRVARALVTCHRALATHD